MGGTQPSPRSVAVQSRQPERRRSRVGLILLLLVAIGYAGYRYFYASDTALIHGELRERLDRCESRGLFDVQVHYASPVSKDEAVFDLQGTKAGARRVDIIHLVCQFGYEAKDLAYRTLILAAKGEEVYRMNKADLDPLAHEYKFGNPVYSIRKWPSNLRTSSGTRVFSEWEGGVLGVLKAEMEDVNKAVDRWIERLSR